MIYSRTINNINLQNTKGGLSEKQSCLVFLLNTPKKDAYIFTT